MCLLTGWTARLCRTFRGTRVMSAMNTPAASNGVKRGATEPDDRSEAKKPRAEGDGGAAPGGEVKPADGSEVPPAERWKLKKVLLLVSYSGKGYLGMQRNPGCRTIEEDLLQALYKARAIPEHGLREQQSVWFQRAARTDKGVSAAKQCVSLKMAADTEGVLDAINAHLPAQIRVFDMRRVTKRFDAKLQCSARTYHYMSPTFAFTPLEDVVSEQYRISEEVLKNVNRLFRKYEGTHNYHNFTSRRKPTDPSNSRFIMSMGCGQPFVREGIEFVVITVKGQSFMLHQIRKMVGTVMAVARGHAPETVFERAWSLDRIDLPVAPALGLMLHEVHYDQYNNRFGSGGHNTHENIDWASVEDKVAAHTEQFIHADMVQTELQDKCMLTWMETLPLHTFDTREGDRSPLLAAKLLAEAEHGAGGPPDLEVKSAEGGTAEVKSAGDGTVEIKSGAAGMPEVGSEADGEAAPSAGETGRPAGTDPADPSAASDGTHSNGGAPSAAPSTEDTTLPPGDKPADSGGDNPVAGSDQNKASS